MSDGYISYDPACRDCRAAAGKDGAGTTWQCVGHVYVERDALRAEIERLRADAEQGIHPAERERDEARALVACGFSVQERDRLEECVGSANVEHAHLTERAIVAERQRDEAVAELGRLALERAHETQVAGEWHDRLLKTRSDLAHANTRALALTEERDTAQAQVRAHRACLAVAKPAAARLRARHDEAVAEVERLRQKVDDLRVISNVNGDWNGRFAAALAMLRELEWRGWERTSQPYNPPAHDRACLVCGGLQSQGHKPDCRLDAFLGGGNHE